MTKLPWKVSGYRPFGIISRDPKESTYEKGDDKFNQFIHFTGNFETMKDNSAYVEKACNLFPGLVEALESTGKWMEFWLEEDLCDCEGAHICGKTERRNELAIIKELLTKAKL